MANFHETSQRQRPYSSLKENVWHIDLGGDSATLITTHARYEVPREDALRFLRMRSHCTGWHSNEEIARKSGLSVDAVEATLDALREVGMVFGPEQGVALEPEQVRATLIKVLRSGATSCASAISETR